MLSHETACTKGLLTVLQNKNKNNNNNKKIPDAMLVFQTPYFF